MLQRYVFISRNNKKMSSQKIHIFMNDPKKVHKKFTSIYERVERWVEIIFVI